MDSDRRSESSLCLSSRRFPAKNLGASQQPLIRRRHRLWLALSLVIEQQIVARQTRQILGQGGMA